MILVLVDDNSCLASTNTVKIMLLPMPVRQSGHYIFPLKLIEVKGGEIRDTKTFNLSRNIVSLQVFVDVSRFSPCVINLTSNKNICSRLKKCGALIG